jgi:hypothetical protein
MIVVESCLLIVRDKKKKKRWYAALVVGVTSCHASSLMQVALPLLHADVDVSSPRKKLIITWCLLV